MEFRKTREKQKIRKDQEGMRKRMKVIGCSLMFVAPLAVIAENIYVLYIYIYIYIYI